MFTYIKESFEELKSNVTWLDREKASNLMVIVAVFSIVFALATWGVDSYFSDAITGNLFQVSTYQGYLEKGVWGILQLIWYIALTVAILLGLSSFMNKKK
ncbi:preprotein translocase subunit SecE [Flagellimonas sp. 389]|nr:preprotein translocase subunit SecE [Flagellimonas sp. 389]